MKKASRRLPPHPRRRQSGRYSAESSERLGRQLSVSVILCAFFMIISFVGGSSPESLRARASELIGRNVLEDFTPQAGLRANIDEFVRCMFDYGDDEKDDGDTKIDEDMKKENEAPFTADGFSGDEESQQDPPPE